MKALIGRGSRPSLGFRIVLLACGACFIAFLLISATIYQLQYESVSKSLIMERSNLCAEASAVAENACAYLRGVADYCSVEFDLEYILNHQHDDSEATLMASDLFSMFQLHNYVLNIILYNMQGIPVQYMSIDASHTPLIQADNAIFQSLITRESTYIWEYVDQDTDYLFHRDNSPKLVLWRVVKSSNNNVIYGVVAASIDVRNLLQYEVSYTSSYRRTCQIFDRTAMRSVANNTDYRLTEDDSYRISKAIGQQTEGNFEISIDGEHKRVFFKQIADTPLTTLYISNGSILANNRAMGMLIIFIIATFCVVMIPLLLYITRNLTRPVERLTLEMEKFSHGDFSASFPPRKDDTIGLLAKSFNHMVSEHKKLIDQTYIAQLKAKEAELILLQAQINPHFIYNLINSIQWSALRKGEKDIANIAYSMGQIFRISLNRGNNIIPVSKECELVTYYLTLQKSRYGAKLNYHIECDEEAGDIHIPKLIIQPLVENAIVHGTEKLVSPINIDTRISIIDGMLLIEVEDNGAGIPPEVLSLLPNQYTPQHTNGSGFALHNIYERLALFYGDGQFDFTISSEVYCGTYITMSLPLGVKERDERSLPCTQ